MVECDGVLVDIHKDAHRVAFNKAFEVTLFVWSPHGHSKGGNGAFVVTSVPTDFAPMVMMQELGLDCVAWTPSVYHDLLRSGDGTAEGIVAAYFGMVLTLLHHSAVPSQLMSMSTMHMLPVFTLARLPAMYNLLIAVGKCGVGGLANNAT